MTKRFEQRDFKFRKTQAISGTGEGVLRGSTELFLIRRLIITNRDYRDNRKGAKGQNGYRDGQHKLQ